MRKNIWGVVQQQLRKYTGDFTAAVGENMWGLGQQQWGQIRDIGKQQGKGSTVKRSESDIHDDMNDLIYFLLRDLSWFQQLMDQIFHIFFK